MLMEKVTPGYVIQTFSEDGVLLKQEFFVEDGGQVEFTDEEGNSICPDKVPFHPFDMKQPEDYT